MGNMSGNHEAVEWGIVWAAENPPEMLTESYVNLVPTVQGGTHVNGLRSGATVCRGAYSGIASRSVACKSLQPCPVRSSLRWTFAEAAPL